MTNLNNIIKKVGYFAIMVSPLEIYQVHFPGLNLSLFRVSFILMILLFIFYTIVRLRIKNKFNIYFLLFISLFSLIIGAVQTKNPSVNSVPYIRNEIIGIIMMFIFINIYDYKDIKNLINSFLSSLLIVFVFNVYTYFYFFYNGSLLTEYPLVNDFSFFVKTKVTYHRFASGGIPRLTIPFAKPPHLAINVSFGLFILYFKLKFSKIKKKLDMLLFLFLIGLLLGSLTRTVFVSVILTFVIYYSFEFFKKRKSLRIKKKKLFFIISTIFVIFLVYFFLIPSSLKEELYKRIYSTFSDSKENRHLLLIFEAIMLWTKSIKNFFFGIGIGNNPKDGVFTNLPPASFLNVYLTILAQRGIIGFAFTFGLYLYIFIKLLHRYSKYVNNYSFAFLFAYINLLIAFIFYELRLILGVWIILSIFLIFIENKIIDNYEN